MTSNEIEQLLDCWYSEQILPSHWIELLKENNDLRLAYNKEKEKRELK